MNLNDKEVTDNFVAVHQAKHEALGYKFALAFPGEYVLMYREKDGSKVRIYENGTVWEYK